MTTPNETSPRLLPRQRAADFLGVSYQTLATWACNRCGPPVVKIGRKAMYSPADLEMYVQQQRTVFGSRRDVKEVAHA